MRRLLLFFLLLATLPIRVQAQDAWVCIDPVGEQWDTRHGYWVVPPGDLTLDVRVSFPPTQAMLTVRSVHLPNPEDPETDIARQIGDWQLEPELSRHWFYHFQETFPAGTYEVKIVAWFGGRRYADTKYICPR
ncbi:MAG: hypothetical protein FJ026_13690 [Chloroflexi bacterium]|nr:hypothetical protein [Chloroflexota bacterium]